MFALVLLLVQSAWSLAPFYAQQEPIDRTLNGVNQRSYFVIFNERAPMLGHDLSKLSSWLPDAMPELDASNIQHMYEIGEEFRGFSVWASPDVVRQLVAHDFVKHIEEDQVMRIAAPFTSRVDWGQMRVNQKGARNLATNPANLYGGTTYPNANNATDGTGGWDWTTAVSGGYRPINGGQNAKIWIVDTGVLTGHQEFNGRVSTSRDFVNTSGNGQDCNGHGTHCAGSAAGRYRGVATGADIGNIRVLSCSGSGTNAGVVAGFDFVCNNKKAGATNILSASLGGGKSATTDNSINACANTGTVPVVAAGNDNNIACNYSPAGATGAVTIGATTSQDGKASFSNYGSCVDVFAPGVSVHSGWYTSNTAYNTISGTSMATPIAAGSIALFATSQTGGATPASVRSAITRTATSGVITGLPSGTVNLLINSNWN